MGSVGANSVKKKLTGDIYGTNNITITKDITEQSNFKLWNSLRAAQIKTIGQGTYETLYADGKTRVIENGIIVNQGNRIYGISEILNEQGDLQITDIKSGVLIPNQGDGMSYFRAKDAMMTFNDMIAHNTFNVGTRVKEFEKRFNKSKKK